MATIQKKKEIPSQWVFGTPAQAGTLRAVVYAGESTYKIPPFSKQVDLPEECLRLEAENAKLRVENETLKAKVVAMQGTNSAEKFLEIREIPREQAKEEIRAFFKAHHGDAIYPSDVMEALALDYDLVYEICEELEKDGAVKGL